MDCDDETVHRPPHGVQIGDILIGSAQPVQFNIETLLARLDDPAVIACFERAHIDVATLRAIVEHNAPIFWTPDTPRALDNLNRDLFPRDEYDLNTPAG